VSGDAFISITGKLSADPAMRFMPDGKPVTNFTIFCGNGRDYKDTPWKIAVWGAMAESCAEHLHKDSVVSVRGALSVQKETGEPKLWTDKSDNQHVELSVMAERVKFIDGFGTRNSDAPAKPAAKTTPRQEYADDDIPF